MDIETFSAYAYFFLTAFVAIMLWWYIYYLYTSKKRGGRDFEKYGKMALNDEITDAPVEKVLKKTKTKKQEA